VTLAQAFIETTMRGGETGPALPSSPQSAQGLARSARLPAVPHRGGGERSPEFGGRTRKRAQPEFTSRSAAKADGFSPPPPVQVGAGESETLFRVKELEHSPLTCISAG
jgi:hypothetical protein